MKRQHTYIQKQRQGILMKSRGLCLFCTSTCGVEQNEGLQHFLQGCMTRTLLNHYVDECCVNDP